jgi:hypothetical protein
MGSLIMGRKALIFHVSERTATHLNDPTRLIAAVDESKLLAPDPTLEPAT